MLPPVAEAYETCMVFMPGYPGMGKRTVGSHLADHLDGVLVDIKQRPRASGVAGCSGIRSGFRLQRRCPGPTLGLPAFGSSGTLIRRLAPPAQPDASTGSAPTFAS